MTPRLIRSLRPIIATVDNIITDDACDSILNNEIQFNQSLGFDYAKNFSTVSSYRSSSTAHDFKNEFGYLRQLAVDFANKYYDTFQLTLDHAEAVQLTKYEVGQEYKRHVDYFNQKDKTAIDNDRCGTVIFYLNDDFEGGETYFPHLDLSIKPKKGMALFFAYNYDADTNHLSTHAGLPVTSGVKTIATIWLHPQIYNGSQPSVR